MPSGKVFIQEIAFESLYRECIYVMNASVR